MSLTQKIQSLTTKANQKTGEQDTTLSDAVDTLIDGYDRIPDGYVKPQGTLDISDGGSHDITMYKYANVRVEMESITVTPNEFIQGFTPSEVYPPAISGFNEIIVNPIPSEYVKPTGTLNIGSGGEYDVTNYKKAYVSTDLTPITVTPEPGPAPTFHFPGDSDTTIMGFSYVVVNPIPSEYIIPEGDINITENGQYDVSEKASVTVDVPTASVEQDYDDVTLPSEYQRVEYIESTGSQYIDLPFGFDPTDEICSVLQLPTSTNSENWLVTETIWNTDNNRFSFGGIQGSSFGVGYGNVPTNGTIMHYPYANDGQFHKHTYKDYLFAIKELGTYLGGVNRIPFGSTTSNLRLFYGYNSNTAGKIRYYIHTKADGTGVALYACYRKSDSIIGMYDVVNNIFYTNTGSGTFEKGADI